MNNELRYRSCALWLANGKCLRYDVRTGCRGRTWGPIGLHMRSKWAAGGAGKVSLTSKTLFDVTKGVPRSFAPVPTKHFGILLEHIWKTLEIKTYQQMKSVCMYRCIYVCMYVWCRYLYMGTCEIEYRGNVGTKPWIVVETLHQQEYMVVCACSVYLSSLSQHKLWMFLKPGHKEAKLQPRQ